MNNKFNIGDFVTYDIGTKKINRAEIIDIPSANVLKVKCLDIDSDSFYFGKKLLVHSKFCKKIEPKVATTPVEKCTFKELVNTIKKGDVFTYKDEDVEVIITSDDNYLTLDIVGDSITRIGYQCKFEKKDEVKSYLLYEVEHKEKGKRYLFRAKDYSFSFNDFVICDTKYGDSYGRIKGIQYLNLSEKEYLEYKECVLA